LQPKTTQNRKKRQKIAKSRLCLDTIISCQPAIHRIRNTASLQTETRVFNKAI